MQNVPNPKDQAKLLTKFLKDQGLSLAHQDSLEAIAKVMGFKNWKTMAATPAGSRVECKVPTKPAATAIEYIPGPSEVPVYSVPVTVEVTMTAYIKVRAFNVDQAVELALERATDIYPRTFEFDEGNSRKGDDFYCPNEGDVVLEESGADEVWAAELAKVSPDILKLTTEDFNDQTIDVCNNMGMRGEFSVLSVGGAYMLSATLDSLNPDNSDDDLRAQCLLTETLEHSEDSDQEGVVILERTVPYEYCGDDRRRGDELEMLFNDRELLGYLLTKN
jgi:hypothetical protein